MRVWSHGAKRVYYGYNLHTEDNNLNAGSQYSYYLIVGTGVGNTSSAMVTVTMPTNLYDNIPIPKLITVQSHDRIFIEWDPFVPSDGAVDQYGVKLNAGLDSEVEMRVGLNLSALVTGLRPFFFYSVRLLVCLAGGANRCGISDAVTVKTKEAPPAGMEAPIIKCRSIQHRGRKMEAATQSKWSYNAVFGVLQGTWFQCRSIDKPSTWRDFDSTTCWPGFEAFYAVRI